MTAVLAAYRENRHAIWLIAAFTALRCAVAPTFGLGTDEAHYVLYAKFLDLSYFDHPPLVGWTHALFFYTLGTNEFLARLPAILLFAVTSFLCYRFTLSIGGERPALLATAALNSSFLLGGLGLMLLPESLLLPLVFALISTVRRLERSPDVPHFIILGVILGLAGLAKYTAVLFVPALAFYAAARKRYDILLDPRLLISAVVALVLISPVLYWNFRNGLASFRFQFGHVAGGGAPDPGSLFRSLGAQFAAYSPPFFCIAWYGLYRSLRSRSDVLLLCAFIGCTVMAFFSVSSLFRFSLPHWSAVFYTLFIPLGVVLIDQGPLRGKRTILVLSVGFSVAVVLLLQLELAVKAFRFPDYRSPFRTVYGTSDVLRRAHEIMDGDPSSRKALAVTNWTDVSRTMYYNAPYGGDIFLIGPSDERFSRWITGSPVGSDLLFLNNHFHYRDVGREMRCGNVEDAGRMDILLRGGRLDTVEFVWCRSFGGVNPVR